MSMLRRSFNMVARLFGWSPVSREVCFVGGEGPWATVFWGATGRITFVDEAQEGAEIIRVALSEEVSYGEIKIQDVLLIPRHVDYGSTALAITCIAAYVFNADAYVAGKPPRRDDMLAIMDVCAKNRWGTT